MGIYDREYYRDDSRGFGLFSGVAPACKALILINVVAYVASVLIPTLQQAFDAQSALIFEQFQVWRLLTATFLHNVRDPLHILFNMLILWWFGRDLESIYGSRDFTIMYLGAAVFSTLCWALADYFGSHADIRTHAMIGASGATTALFVLYATYYPRREVLLFFVLPLEIWLLLTIYLSFQTLQLFQGTAGQVAVASHLGGALYGYLYKVGDLRFSRLDLGRRRRPKFRIVRPEPMEMPSTRVSSGGPTWTPEVAESTRSAPTVVATEDQLEAKLDEVLAKIAREGRTGLTEDDHRILQEASRRARNRRGERR
ncbi:rhomboid family intramembrane serine protease [Isosphaeraceae bacterium EP7]